MDRGDFKNKTFGSLLSVFVGDGMGLPAECQSPESICEKFGYIDWYESNHNHPYKSVAKHPRGTISDDSQLTLCMMESLSKGFSLDSIKSCHVEAFDGKWGKPVGWGKSTVAAIKKIKSGDKLTFAKGGAGNGPVIKIAPLAIWCVYKTQGKFDDKYNLSLLEKCKLISQLSHEDPACIVAAYCHCKMIIRAFQNEWSGSDLLPHQIAGQVIDDAKFAESNLDEPGNLSNRLEHVLNWKADISGDELSVFDLSTAKVSKIICTSQSSYIYNSYPLVVYCCAKYLPYRNLMYAITETVNAGADADSNASMVGAVVGALLGLGEIPIETIRGLSEWQMLYENVSRFEQSL